MPDHMPDQVLIQYLQILFYLMVRRVFFRIVLEFSVPYWATQSPRSLPRLIQSFVSTAKR